MRHYRLPDFEHPMCYKVTTAILCYLVAFPVMYFMFKHLIPMFEGEGLVFRNGAPLLGGFMLTTFMLIEEFVDFDRALDAYNKTHSMHVENVDVTRSAIEKEIKNETNSR